MKKTSKIACLITVLAVMAAASVSAKSKSTTMPVPGPSAEKPDQDHGQNPVKPPKNEPSFLGQVTKVNTTDNTLSVKDLDGVETSFTITPFAQFAIFAADSKIEDKPAEGKLSDVTTGDWVMISAFDTDTKTKAIRKVTVKKNSSKTATK